jgi:DNA-binding beta-propeller fold protein YncE/mono/diheme cytochrome c family protein
VLFAAAIAFAALPLAGCAGEAVSVAPAPSGRAGASIAILASTGEVAVVNPDQGSVSLLDANTLEQRAVIEVGGEPHALLETASGELFVTTYRGGEVVKVDPARLRVTDRRRVCAGPWGIAEGPGGSVVVACEWEGAIVRLSTQDLSATVIARGLSRPRALVSLGDEVIAAGFTGGRIYRVTPDGSVATTSLVPRSAAYRPAVTSMTANLAAAVLLAGGRLYVAHELVNHDGNTQVEKVADDYGSVVDGNPKINPALTSLVDFAAEPAGAEDPPVLYAKYDGGPRVFNGPSALAAAGPDRVLVAHLSTNDVAVIDALAADPDGRAIGSFAVGAGPSGIAVSADGHTAFVDNAFDASVSKIDLTSPLGASAPRHEAALTRARDLPARFSAAALAGRKIFHDASNSHITPSAVVACSTCHPGGTDDGLVWFIHTSKIPLKRRRTPNLSCAHSSTAPFHWDGAFPSMSALASATIRDLMAGNGLLVDVDSVQAYIDEIVAPAVPPEGDAGAIARGRAVFESADAACAACHGGPDLTDNGFHAVLSPMSLSADDVIEQTNTPALHGLFLRAPYFHDGRAADLREVLLRPDASAHGGAGKLSPAQIDDLVAYLASL